LHTIPKRHGSNIFDASYRVDRLLPCVDSHGTFERRAWSERADTDTHDHKYPSRLLAALLSDRWEATVAQQQDEVSRELGRRVAVEHLVEELHGRLMEPRLTGEERRMRTLVALPFLS
jgi:hypothetical protein